MDLVAKRFDVFLINLDPTVGSEIRETRPCVVISPAQMNRHLRTVIVAPTTAAGFAYPMRVVGTFQGKNGHIRLVKRLGQMSAPQASATLAVLSEMFAA